MHQGNWTCSSCGGAITELPFQPRSEAGLTCRACYAKQKNGNQAAATQASSPSNASEAPEFTDADFAPEFGADEFGEAYTAPAASTTAPQARAGFSGEWKCSGCSSTITSLPFQPRDTSNLKCLDCYKKSKV